MAPTKTVPRCLAWLWREGIGFRLAVLVCLILLPFVALSGFIYQQRYEYRRSMALQTETEMAEGLAVAFSTYLKGVHKQNLSLGHAITILSPGKDGAVHRLLIASDRDSPSVVSTSWVTPLGKVLATSAPANGELSLADAPVFLGLIQGREMALGDLAPRGVFYDKPCFALATAIRDERGTLQGAMVVEIDPSALSPVVLVQRHLPQADLSLFDSRGTLVYQGGTGRDNGSVWSKDDPLLFQELTTRLPLAGIRSGAGGTEYVSALVPVPQAGWTAGASCSTEVAFAEVRRGLLVDLSLGLGALALAFLFAWLLGRNIVAPLRRLQDDAHLMAQEREVPLIDPFAPREVATLRAAMLGMTADLTRRAQALRESEELLRSVFENVYDGVLIHDGEGKILHVNERWLRIFGVTREEVPGLSIADISVNPPPQEELIALWRQILAGDTKLFEWVSQRPKDRSQLDVEVFLCPIRFKGQPVIMACVRDITERKRVAAELQRYRDELETRVQERTEELGRAVEKIQKETAQRVAAVEELRRKEQLLIQQSRLAAMGEMMGNVAHQWRQPLNLLGLIVQELKISYQKGNFTEELLLGATTKAMTVIGHMSQTIDDFRNLLSPDKVKLRFTAREVVDKVLSMMQLQVEVKVLAEAECEMEGSRNEYSQVIINILMNARDVFRERNVQEPVVTIRLFREEGRSVVTIADNGGGIDEAVMDRIFDPYFTTKGPDKGTGLGLFMSKAIIEKSMHGRLSVRNTAEGAEFRIEV